MIIEWNPDWLRPAFMWTCIAMAVAHYWLVHENMVRRNEPFRLIIAPIYAAGAVAWLFAGVLYYHQIMPARPLVVLAMCCTVATLFLVAARLWVLNARDGFAEPTDFSPREIILGLWRALLKRFHL